MLKMNKKGFTLVELMVVLAILGLLAGIGIPMYMKTLERSREATDLANMGRLQEAIDTWVSETNYVIPDKQLLGAGGGDIWTQTGADIPKSILNNQGAPLAEYWKGKLPEIKSAQASGGSWYVVNGKVVITTAEESATILLPRP